MSRKIIEFSFPRFAFGWAADTKKTISRLLAAQPSFFELNSNTPLLLDEESSIRIHIEFSSDKGLEDFQHSYEGSRSTISMRDPIHPQTKSLLQISRNADGILQAIFLHEVGHALFKTVFGAQANPANAIRTMDRTPFRSLLSEIDNSASPFNAEKIGGEDALKLYGMRFQERFSDAFAILAGHSLGIPAGALRLLYLSRSGEAHGELYDTAETIRIAQSHITSQGTSFSLDQCLSIAETCAFTSLLLEWQRIGGLPKTQDTFDPGLILSMENSQNILTRLYRKRTGRDPNPSELFRTPLKRSDP